MIRILHVAAVKEWGGGENHIENLYHELSTKYKNEVKQCILCVEGSEFHKRLKVSDFDYITAPLAIKMDIRFSLKIIRLCRSKKIDIVHMHDPTALTLTVIADRLYNKLPSFIYHKKTSFPIKNRKQTLFKYNYPKIKKMICVSEATKKVAEKSIIDHSKLVSIYNGIRFDNKTNKAPFQLREKYNIPNQKILIGHIGNHIRAKNLLTYVDVINELVNIKKVTNFHFVQIGSFTDRTPMYTEKVKELHLQNHVTFTGFLDNASAFLSQFDIFLFTSQSEGLPQVINEAFYFKVPVVTTNAGGIPEIVKDGVNGFMSNVEDYKDLANKLVEISNNKNIAKQFTDKSYQQVIARFSSEINAEKVLDVYKSII